MSDLDRPPVHEAPPKKTDESKTWLQAIGITFGVTFAVIAGFLAVAAIVILLFVGLILFTCSSH
ncbi:MAG: hypothetical protein KC619_31855 [Myxococcales bacterium]|nr:hypothetical protein [Myxococcales bacterium]